MSRRYLFLPTALWAVPASAQALDHALVPRALLSLLFVVGLILLLGWLVRGRALPLRVGLAGQLRVRAQLPLGPRDRLLVVRVGSEEVLVGVSPAGLRTLHVLAHPLPEDADHEPGQVTFAQRLKAALRPGGETP
ncbi:MAG TPA: flagellar biosynthetic protein FliO [Steroidobacteraceae bacterium]|nr:flagellar biosynthetic protein FliO [Steroidobacteraceae bacterium]